MHTSWFVPGLFALALSLAGSAHAQDPTAADTGDPDAFGKDVVHVGLVQVSSVTLRSDCEDPDIPKQPGERCIQLGPQPELTEFNEDNLAEIKLPAEASRSLLCFSITPFMSFGFSNQTDTRQTASFRARALVTIENEVLNDPLLIDPTTGLPYGGRMTTSVSTYIESSSIDPGESEQKSLFLSRHCIAGFSKKSSLIAMGFTEAQATEFYRKPMRLIFGSAGSGAMLSSASFFYGLRLYGDR